jgi:UDP-N-acetylglucosamine--N-acetylmuramyl-(pentapeptide) pyrophosphoryl-undecaprenol N-acetylglucosamine transferase
VVPALAVAAALQAEGAQVSFIGGQRAEAQLVPASGFALHTISVEGLSRTNPLRAARALLRAVGAFVKARRLLGQLSATAVMGGGGYVAGPVGLAALSRRIPLILTEADSHLGLTNRLLAPFSRRVCLSFALAGRHGARYRLTGRPIAPIQKDRLKARQRFGIEAEKQCVLIFGGSLGARSINQAAIDAFADAEDFYVLHVCGHRDYLQLAKRPRAQHYDLREYLDLKDFADALASADLVIARAGGSVFEIAANGLPAILVPYPHASGDHQNTNAQWMSKAGAAIVISDNELSSAVLGTQVTELLADRLRLETMAQASRRLARPEAAREVAQELLDAAS